ncbi:hypothetical protein ACFQZ4_48475 [Catellatospora coxensis]
MTHKRWSVRLRERNGGTGLWWGLVVVLVIGLVVEGVRELSAATSRRSCRSPTTGSARGSS